MNNDTLLDPNHGPRDVTSSNSTDLPLFQASASDDVSSETHWPFLALALIPAWILSGNFLVLMAVLRQRSLRTLSNCVIASLAFTDFLLAFLVVPLGVYQLVAGQWNLGLYVCLFWTGSDVVLSTTSIMHLCAIALYRYNGIANPLHVRSTQEIRHVAALVAPSWLIAVALSVPFAVQGATNTSHVLISHPGSAGQSCGLFNRTFAIYSSLVSFFLPLAVMIFADIRSIQILRKNIPNLQSTNTRRPRRRSRKNDETTAECNVDNAPTIQISRVTAAVDDDDDGDVSTMTKSAAINCSLLDSSPMRPSNASSSEMNLLHVSPFRGQRTSLQGRRESVHDGDLDAGSGRPARTTRHGLSHTVPVQKKQKEMKEKSRSKSVIYISMFVSGGGSVKINSRERRAERTLIWVFVAFVVLWLPFFCTNLTYGLCDTCRIPSGVFAVFTWLGYLSSGVNPCIYTYLNRDFRNAFKKILTCKRIGRPRMPRQYS